jgi:sterol desaturase/sphingolipid hydroxylase (fatty acid hydroxylase superfamily)
MKLDLQNVQLLSVFVIFALFAGAELLMGHFFPSAASAEDNRLDVAVGVTFPIISGSVFAAAKALCAWCFPEMRDAWADWPWWQMVLVLLVADDLTQYWWHRISHTHLMWPLHRAHHSARYMSIRMTFRNNLFYYLMMPGLWIGGVLLFLGFGAVYAGYIVVQLVVILGAHCAWRWDEPLYRIPALRPLMWVLERTISTPATHFAHHALVQDDGIGHYTGNYGNLLFVWDMLLGTARITRRYPPAYGLQDDRRHGPEHWLTQLTFPLRRSQRAETVFGRGSHRPLD